MAGAGNLKQRRPCVGTNNSLPLTGPQLLSHTWKFREQIHPAGRGQTLVWDCGDAAPGIYLVRVLKEGNFVETLKVSIVR